MSIVGKTQRERHLFLFNDILLCVQPKKNKGLDVDFLEPLETLRVEDVYQEDIKGIVYPHITLLITNCQILVIALDCIQQQSSTPSYPQTRPIGFSYWLILFVNVSPKTKRQKIWHTSVA